VRFWDTSALVPILIDEPATPAARRSLDEDESVAAWWGTGIECTAAVARAVRDGRLASGALASVLQDLERWRADWIEVDATPPLRLLAERLVRTHPLRAADGLQLAAALTAAEGSPATLPFVTRDARLADAAILEGFPVIRFDQP
jgi:predicted nucleic acid-binding protein